MKKKEKRTATKAREITVSHIKKNCQNYKRSKNKYDTEKKKIKFQKKNSSLG